MNKLFHCFQHLPFKSHNSLLHRQFHHLSSISCSKHTKHEEEYKIHPELFQTVQPVARKPTKEEAMQAVRTLISYMGDNPEREGLRGTPDRVVRSYDEFFRGYNQDPKILLERTFEEIHNYDEMVILKDIRLESYCEHHMVPIIGKAHVAYLPNTRVVGISKLARVVEMFSKRLQIQEKLTAQIAETIYDVLKPKGVAVVIEAQHQCMTTRGVHKTDVAMITSHMIGAFRTDEKTRREFLSFVK